MKISVPRHPGPMLSVIFLIAALGLIGGAVWYALDQSGKYTDITGQLGVIEAQARRVDTLESRWNSISAEAEVIEIAFVRRDQLSTFLESVEATAANAGVHQNWSIVNEEPDEITLRLRVSGAFQDIYTFATHLNVLPNLLFLESVEFFSGAVAAPSELAPEQIEGYSSGEIIIRVPLQIRNEL